MSELELKAKLLASLKKNLNLGGLMADLLDEVLEPTLQKIVDDSTNPWDNMIMASLYPVLEKELKEKLEELINKVLA